jgi:glycosyltransferase involved in cell wall biosynthesis
MAARNIAGMTGDESAMGQADGGRAGLLSVVMPCFNEAATVALQLKRVLAAETLGMTLEVIVVDDGSSDRSTAIVDDLCRLDSRLRLLRQDRNRGKGAALRRGIEVARGEIVLIQDADLEYDPAEYPRLLGPFVHGVADVVYGSRFRGGQEVRVLYFWHSVANRMLTTLSNMLTNLNLSDMETGFKAFRQGILHQITLKEDRFGFEPEVTAKLARLRPLPRIYEVSISYYGRTYAEGKKIGLKDAIRTLFCIIVYSFW